MFADDIIFIDETRKLVGFRSLKGKATNKGVKISRFETKVPLINLPV